MMYSPIRRQLVALLVVGVSLLAGTACSSSKSAKKDVRITSCHADSDEGKPTAAGTILNHTSKTSAYTVHVKFYDSSGNAVGDGLSAVVSVDPEETAQWDTKGSVDAKGPVTCELESVTRNVSI